MFLKQNKLKILLLCYLNIITILYFNFKDSIKNPAETLRNFEILVKPIKLKNILTDDEFLKNPRNKKIFFIESHSDSERVLENPRHACSIESAARTNPEIDVYLNLVTNKDGVNLEYSELVKILSKYRNIHFRFLNPTEFSRGTFLEEFFQKDLLKNSTFKVANMANVLRVLIMSRYGGQYLDLDVISLVPLIEIPYTNYGCVETEDIVNNAVLNFDVESGQEILREYGRLLLNEFQPNVWGANGPKMFSKVLKTFCNGTKFVEDGYTKCGEFTTLPTSKCYEIKCPEYGKFYEEDFRNETLQRLKDKKAFFVHIYNKMQDLAHKSYTLKGGSRSAYAELARMHCPLVFKTIEKNF